VCSGVPDLRDALDRYVRYLTSWNPALPVSVQRTAGGALIRQRIPGEPLCLGRHGNEHWVCSVLLGARRVAQTPCVPLRVGLAHAGPPEPAFARLVGTERIDFGGGENVLEVSNETLATPLVWSPSTVSSLLDRYATFAAADRAPRGTFDDRVRAAIRDRLHESMPTVAVVARAIGLSARTLQRRLAEEGQSFAGLVDALRADLARRHVKDAILGVGEIAGRLGYAETTAFLRAFKRWTGTTPKRLREGREPEGGGEA
jgi:AraC-like DNA-binding protein